MSAQTTGGGSLYLADEAVDVPLVVHGLDGPVRDRESAAAALGADQVHVAGLAVGLAVSLVKALWENWHENLAGRNNIYSS